MPTLSPLQTLAESHTLDTAPLDVVAYYHALLSKDDVSPSTRSRPRSRLSTQHCN